MGRIDGNSDARITRLSKHPHHRDAPHWMPAWEEIYDEWRMPLLRYVHRLTRDPHLAEDVTHEAFLRLLREQREVRDPRAWLFRVCTNIVRDHARRLATEDRNPIMPESSTPEQPDVACERAEVVSMVRSALERLSPRDREALLLRESGFRYAEIAEVIGVRTEIVPTLIARALRRLQKSYRMEGRDVASA